MTSLQVETTGKDNQLLGKMALKITLYLRNGKNA
jgi:hypothetical protein